MKDDHRPTVDFGWLQGRGRRRRPGVATLRATVTNPRAQIAQHQVDTWLATIAGGSGDSRWTGGWSVEIKSRSTDSVVLDLSSSGEDVADSLSAAVDGLLDAVLKDGTTLTWAPQPVRRRAP